MIDLILLNYKTHWSMKMILNLENKKECPLLWNCPWKCCILSWKFGSLYSLVHYFGQRPVLKQLILYFLQKQQPLRNQTRSCCSNRLFTDVIGLKLCLNSRRFKTESAAVKNTPGNYRKLVLVCLFVFQIAGSIFSVLFPNSRPGYCLDFF